MKLTIFVPGIAKPGGSKRVLQSASTGKLLAIEDCKASAPWRERVVLYAQLAYRGEPLFGPLEVEWAFVVPRPKAHYRSGRHAALLLRSAPVYPTVKPDVTKLIRSSEDALTSILWHDDAQIVRQSASKDYGAPPGVRISVWTLETGAGGQS